MVQKGLGDLSCLVSMVTTNLDMCLDQFVTLNNMGLDSWIV